MVAAVRRPGMGGAMQSLMRVPPKPRSPFGGGPSWMFGGMPDYIQNANASPKITMRPPSDQPAQIPPGRNVDVQGPPPTEAEMANAPIITYAKPDAAPKAMQSQRGANQTAAQTGGFDPSQGLYGQKFEKPKMTWADKLGLLGGMLMDYDGTFGQGNADAARARYDQSVQDAQAEFDRNRQEAILAAAAAGDPMALAYLDPIGARNFQYQQGRDAVGDQQYDQQYADQRGDRAADIQYRDQVFDYRVTQDQLAQKNWESSFGLDQRQVKLAEDKAAAEAAATPEINVDDEGQFRREYNTVTKEFRDVQAAYGRIKATDPNTAAGQISLVFQYMKMLDPGSTVREGEFATAENARGVPEGVMNTYNAIMRGTRLTQDQINDFKGQAGQLYRQSLDSYDKTRTVYEGISQGYGFDVGRTVPDLATMRPDNRVFKGGNFERRIPQDALMEFYNDRTPDADQEFDAAFGPGAAEWARLQRAKQASGMRR